MSRTTFETAILVFGKLKISKGNLSFVNIVFMN